MDTVGALGGPTGANSNLLGLPSPCPWDEDDESLVREGIWPKSSPEPRRRSSASSDDSQPPPSSSRRVSFADTFGLNLVSVKQFDTWAVTVPPESHLNEEKEYFMIPLFVLPQTGLELEMRVLEKKIELENLELLPRTTTVRGVIRVLNLCLDKMVYVRTSLDSWRSHFDLLAEYVPGSHDGEMDCFSFKLTLVPPFGEEGARVDFCLRYETSLGTFWANNNGNNFAVYCCEKTKEKPQYESESRRKSCLRGSSSNVSALTTYNMEFPDISLNCGQATGLEPQNANAAELQKESKELLEEISRNRSRRNRRKAARLTLVKDYFARREEEEKQGTKTTGSEVTAKTSVQEHASVPAKESCSLSQQTPPVPPTCNQISSVQAECLESHDEDSTHTVTFKQRDLERHVQDDVVHSETNPSTAKTDSYLDETDDLSDQLGSVNPPVLGRQQDFSTGKDVEKAWEDFEQDAKQRISCKMDKEVSTSKEEPAHRENVSLKTHPSVPQFFSQNYVFGTVVAPLYHQVFKNIQFERKDFIQRAFQEDRTLKELNDRRPRPVTPPESDQAPMRQKKETGLESCVSTKQTQYDCESKEQNSANTKKETKKSLSDPCRNKDVQEAVPSHSCIKEHSTDPTNNPSQTKVETISLQSYVTGNNLSLNINNQFPQESRNPRNTSFVVPPKKYFNSFPTPTHQQITSILNPNQVELPKSVISERSTEISNLSAMPLVQTENTYNLPQSSEGPKMLQTLRITFDSSDDHSDSDCSKMRLNNEILHFPESECPKAVESSQMIESYEQITLAFTSQPQTFNITDGTHDFYGECNNTTMIELIENIQKGKLVKNYEKECHILEDLVEEEKENQAIQIEDHEVNQKQKEEQESAKEEKIGGGIWNIVNELKYIDDEEDIDMGTVEMENKQNQPSDLENQQSDSVKQQSNAVNQQSDSVKQHSNAVNQQSDSVNEQSHSDNQQSDFENQQSDSENVQSDLGNQQSDSLNRQSDLVNQQTDSVNQPSDLENQQSDSVNRQSDLVNQQTDSVNEQSDLENHQADSVNQHSDSDNQQSDLENQWSDLENQQSYLENQQADSVNRQSDSVNKQSQPDPENQQADSESDQENQQSYLENQQSDSENQRSDLENQQADSVNRPSVSVNRQSDSVNPQSQSDLENQQSDPENQQSDPENQQSDPETQQSDPEYQQSDPETQQSDPETQQSDPETQQSDPENQQSDPENQQSDLENQQSDLENQQSDLENQQSDLENQQSALENQQADSENRQPDSENRQSGSVNRQSDSENQQSDLENQQSDPENQRSDLENQQADSVNRQSDSVNRQSQSYSENQQSDLENQKSYAVTKESGSANQQSDSINQQSDSVNQQSDLVNQKSYAVTQASDSANQQSDSVNQQLASVNQQSDLENQHLDSDNQWSDLGNQQSDLENQQSDTENQQSDPENQQLDSENQQSDLENPQSDPENKQLDSENQQSDPENQQLDSENQQSDPENQKGDSENWQLDSENQQSDPENQQLDSENQQSDPENQQLDSENQQSDPENQKGDSENWQLDSENQQSDPENQKLDSENQQSDPENQQLDSENQQSDLENQQADSVNRQSDPENQQLDSDNQQSDSLNQHSYSVHLQTIEQQPKAFISQSNSESLHHSSIELDIAEEHQSTEQSHSGDEDSSSAEEATREEPDIFWNESTKSGDEARASIHGMRNDWDHQEFIDKELTVCCESEKLQNKCKPNDENMQENMECQSKDSTDAEKDVEDNTSTESLVDDEMELYLTCLRNSQQSVFTDSLANVNYGKRHSVSRGRSMSLTMPSISESVDEDQPNSTLEKASNTEDITELERATLTLVEGNEHVIWYNVLWWKEFLSYDNMSRFVGYSFLLILFFVVAYYYDFAACFALYLLTVYWLFKQSEEEPVIGSRRGERLL